MRVRAHKLRWSNLYLDAERPSEEKLLRRPWTALSKRNDRLKLAKFLEQFDTEGKDSECQKK